uniref:Uncharacterized protein n=1 Tax=Avena sativa TaxID=4498 RepID=A0ACD6A5U7_AVESA
MAAPASAAGFGGMTSDNAKGLALAVSSSAFIGASFIVKKLGLKRAADSGVRAGYGGYSYLVEPLWWIGMISMIVGEIANFAAYAFAPAILVTPLGALSIIISAALAHSILQEKLHTFGILGCALCVVGSITIALHAPPERDIDSVREVWDLATEPAFLSYAAIVVAAALVLIYFVVPQHGQTNIMVYIGVCSLLGSLTVMSVKALGIALKLTFSGVNQLFYPQTWAFALIVATCVSTQINYLNKTEQSTISMTVMNIAQETIDAHLWPSSKKILHAHLVPRDTTLLSPYHQCCWVTILHFSAVGLYISTLPLTSRLDIREDHRHGNTLDVGSMKGRICFRFNVRWPGLEL